MHLNFRNQNKRRYLTVMVISNKPLKVILVALVAILPFVSLANPTEEKEAAPTESTDVKSEIKEFINHHLLDAHDFTFNADKETGEHNGFSLPIILWDNGLQVFSSGEFHHGEKVAESNGNYYVIHHEKIYKTDASGKLTEDEKTGHPTNVQPLDLSITKSVIGILFVAFLMFFLFRSLAKSYAKNGGIASGAGRFFEPLVLYVRDEIAIPNIGEKNYKKYMSYLLTIFFFVFFLNILGLTPLGFNVTGNIAITASLALLTYLITTFSANKNYWAHIFWMPGVPTPMKFILAPIELLGTVIKPFSLMIRLYANILAGHVVLMSIIGLMFIFKSWIGSSLSFGLAFALSILEILVAFLQAYIFTMLSALYFGAGNEEHHHEEAHH
ncbi:MAG: synthase subunit [Bacteroidota bacterium]